MTVRQLFTAILFLLLFAIAAREISDPDFWWHLRTGQFIAETVTIPRADIFSHTNFGKPWVTHEWLSELFIFAVFRLGSFPLLTLVFAAVITLAFALTYSRCDGKPMVAGFAVLFAAFATAPTWGVRPQMLSMLLMSLFLYLLAPNLPPAPSGTSEGARGSGRLLLLIPLMLLWVNLHSGFMLGIAVTGVYLLGEIAERLFSASPPHFSRADLIAVWRDPRLKTLALVFIGCLAVVPFNPNGATMYVYPFETLTSHAMQTYIQEWFSPDFHAAQYQPFAFLLLATLASSAISRKKPTLTDLLLLVGSGYAGLRSARNIPFFALIAAPILARSTWDWLQARGWVRHIEFRTGLTRWSSILNWVLFLVIGLAALARVAQVVTNQSSVERERFPAAAVDFMNANGVKGELYNSYGWGGYLIWRLYPRRVFIDGRADVYGDAFIEEFLRMYRGEAGWDRSFERYRVGTVLIEPDAPLAMRLAQDPAWRRVYADDQTVVFEK